MGLSGRWWHHTARRQGATLRYECAKMLLDGIKSVPLQRCPMCNVLRGVVVERFKEATFRLFIPCGHCDEVVLADVDAVLVAQLGGAV